MRKQAPKWILTQLPLLSLQPKEASGGSNWTKSCWERALVLAEENEGNGTVSRKSWFYYCFLSMTSGSVSNSHLLLSYAYYVGGEIYSCSLQATKDDHFSNTLITCVLVQLLSSGFTSTITLGIYIYFKTWLFSSHTW